MERIAAINGVESPTRAAVVGGVPLGLGSGPPATGPTGGARSRSDFEAAMRAAENRIGESFDVTPQVAGTASLPDIGTGLQNVAKSFSAYNDAHNGPELKAIIGSDTMDPHFLMDLQAYAYRGAVNNLQFTVAGKIVGGVSKNLDTLFKSS